MAGFKRDSFHVLFNLDEYRFSFRGLLLLLIAFVGFHFLAAILAPAFYKLVIVWNALSPNSLNTYLIGKPFPEFYDRTRILLLLLSIPWLFMQCRLLSGRKLGFVGDFPWYSTFLRFYMVGLVWSVAVLGILMIAGAVAIKSSLSFWSLLAGLAGAFISAMIIGILEELIFRSLFFRMFYTALAPMISVILSSLFFAYMHFKHPSGLWDYNTPPAEVSWLDGFPVGFYVIFGIVVNFKLVLFLNLTLVGYVLTVVFMKTRSLWSSIGLHAGWVTPISLFMHIAVRNIDKHSAWWGTFRLADGYFTSFCLLLIAFYFSRIYKPREPSSFTF